MPKERILNIIKGASAILLYFFVSLFKETPLTLVGVDYNNLPIIFKEIYNISIQVIMIIVFILIFKDFFKKSFADIKKIILLTLKSILNFIF